MLNRKWISDLVEPKKPGVPSQIYDTLMLVAIVIGSVSLLFREYRPLFWYFDLFSGGLYMVDYLLRWTTCDLRSDKPKWKAFLLYPVTPMAILDLLSILPTFEVVSSSYRLVKSARLLKIVRFTKIVHYIGPLEVFVNVVKKQWKMLMAVALVAVFDILITAILMFQSEQEIDPVTGEYIFKTFYDAFYWAAITLTTVGYGDLCPVSALGKTLSIISSLLGIGIIAMPSSIITAGFMQEMNQRKKESNDNTKNTPKMKADQIIKNAKIFTSDMNTPQATALVVKDGKFVYVGDEAGLTNYEGEVTDLGGKFIMPGIIDSHVHVTIPVAFDYADLGVRFEPEGKRGAIDFMAGYVKEHPDQKSYRFLLERHFLNGEEITKEDLDAVCPDKELILLEGECHSNWVNSKVLERMGIHDDTPDPVPGLAYYVRKDGHVTGNSFETASWPILFDGVNELTDEQIATSLMRWIEYSKNMGVSAVFDAGFPEHNPVHERMYDILCKMDKEGKLPTYIDGCYVLTRPSKMHEAIEEVKRFNRKFNSEHLKVHTLKIFMDGTLKIETAAQVTPYVDTGVTGTTAFKPAQVAEILKALNEAGLDLHVHTVGAAASRVVLDGVELARKELGDKYHMKVTCAHLEVQDDADLDRFAKLGVFANFTPWWHNGGGPGVLTPMLGEKRATHMYRCKTVWNTGATVAWSSDNVAYGDFMTWNPYLGMEIGMTRTISEKTNVPPYCISPIANPPAEERMNIEEMIIGYTINGAKQLGVEASKGSITAGKDADFLVFDKDLLTAEKEGFSYNKPAVVYFGGKKVN